MIYLVVLILLLIGSLNYDFKGQALSAQNKYYLFVTGLMIIIAGLAYNLGGDTERYVVHWNTWPKLTEIDASYHLTPDFSRFQPGWVLFQSLFRTLFDNFIYFQFFHNLIVCLAVFYFIRTHTNNPFIAILMFFLINYLEFNFEIMRESLAVASSLVAFDMLERKKYYWMVFFVVLAFSFHASAVIVPIILLLSKMSVSKKGELVLIGVCLAFPVVMFFLFDRFGAILFALLSDGEHFEDLYTLEENYRNINGYLMQLIEYLLIPVLATIFIKDARQKKYIYLAYLYALFRLTALYSIALYRFGNYCSIFYFIVIAELVFSLVNTSKFNKFVVVLFFTLFCLWSFDSRLLGPDFSLPEYGFVYRRYFPYEWVLSPGNSY